MANPLDVVIGAAEVALWLLLLGAAAHLARSGMWAWRRRVEAPPRMADGAHPRVTVLLPIRNERYVVERTLRAACALSWPRAELEIRVLDDSDDDTSTLLDRVAAELRGEGAPVAVLRRGDRRGFKAGALEQGLRATTGAYVCVLDADCIPPPDLLERLIPPLLADPRLGFTQARWDYENERAGLLTRVQALILDGLFLVEQSRQSALGRPVQFNGTCGVWRRAALEAAGGFWREGTDGPGPLTEDLELSARAELAGYRGDILPGVAVATELPGRVASFRSQQKRWVAGAGQVLRDRWRRTGRAGALLHLLRHARQQLLVVATLWLPATALDWVRPFPSSAATLGVWIATLSLLHLGLFLYYGAALRRRGRSPIPALGYAPLLVALSVGLCIALSAAYLGGVLGRGGEFVRTVKTGGGPDRGYRAPLDPLAFVEAAVGVAYVGVAGLAFARGSVLAGAALLFWVAGGYLWIGLGSLVDR